MKRNIKTARTTCLRNFQKLRVLQESHNGMATCISCGNELPIEKMHGGHFIEANSRSTELIKMNVNPQCPSCNVFKHGNLLKYRRRLVELYGEDEVRSLEDKGWNSKQKRTYEYYREMNKIILKEIKWEKDDRQGKQQELSCDTRLDDKGTTT